MENQTKYKLNNKSPFDAFGVDLNKLQTEIKKLLPDTFQLKDLSV